MRWLILAVILLVGCEKSPTEPKTHTITFNNKTFKSITIKDNSGRDMFSDITVVGYSEDKTLTYECPSVGSCAIDFIYSWKLGTVYGGPSIGICTQGYVYNKTYTFGFDLSEYIEEHEYTEEEMNMGCNSIN